MLSLKYGGKNSEMREGGLLLKEKIVEFVEKMVIKEGKIKM